MRVGRSFLVKGAVVIATCFVLASCGSPLVEGDGSLDANQVLQETVTRPVDIGGGALGSTDTNLDVNNPLIAVVADRYMNAYPLPPGADKSEAFAPIIATFPIPEGEGLNHATDEHPRWAQYFDGFGYRPLDVPEPELTNTALAISELDLSGTVAMSAANAWYAYWLGATAQQRKKAQSSLDSIATWPDLAYRLGCTDTMSCPGQIIELAAIAQAAKDGNPQPMRRWLDQF
jgi:hypothetical protein